MAIAAVRVQVPPRVQGISRDLCLGFFFENTLKVQHRYNIFEIYTIVTLEMLIQLFINQLNTNYI